MEEKSQNLEQKVSDESCPGSIVLAGSIGALAMFSAGAYAGFCKFHPEFRNHNLVEYVEFGSIAAGAVLGGLLGVATGIGGGIEGKKDIPTKIGYGLLGLPIGITAGGVISVAITTAGFGAGYLTGILTQ